MVERPLYHSRLLVLATNLETLKPVVKQDAELLEITRRNASDVMDMLGDGEEEDFRRALNLFLTVERPEQQFIGITLRKVQDQLKNYSQDL